MILANDLINEALSYIGGDSPAGIIDAYKKKSSLKKFNTMLSSFYADSNLLPYAIETTFPISSEKREYVIGTTTDADVDAAPFSEIQFVSISDGSVSYNVPVKPQSQYKNYNTLINTYGIPSFCYIINGDGFNRLFFSINPIQAYSCMITGKKAAKNVSFNDMIDLPAWMEEFLTLSLAFRLSAAFALNSWSPELQLMLKNAEEFVKSKSEKIDTTIVSKPPIRGSRDNFNDYYYLRGRY